MIERPPTVSGLLAQHPRTCPCGVVFTARKASSRYCSNSCRQANSRYGRGYGQYAPKVLGQTQS